MVAFETNCSVFAFLFSRVEVQAPAGLPCWLPLHCANRGVHNALLSPQCGPVREHLPGHSERELVGPLRSQNHSSLHPVTAGRAQHKQPPQRRSLTAVVKSGGIQEITAGKIREGIEKDPLVASMCGHKKCKLAKSCHRSGLCSLMCLKIMDFQFLIIHDCCLLIFKSPRYQT